MVYPSGAARATMAPAMVPAAPPWFSTTTGTPRRLLSPSATMRATPSLAPPGGNETMRRIGRSGNAACALPVTMEMAQSTATTSAPMGSGVRASLSDLRDGLAWWRLRDCQLFSNSRQFAISILTRNGDHRTDLGEGVARMRMPRFAAHAFAIVAFAAVADAGPGAGMAVGHGARRCALCRRRTGRCSGAALDRAAGGADQRRIHPGESARRRRLDRPAGRRAGCARRRHLAADDVVGDDGARRSIPSWRSIRCAISPRSAW